LVTLIKAEPSGTAGDWPASEHVVGLSHLTILPRKLWPFTFKLQYMGNGIKFPAPRIRSTTEAEVED
jgi:hypothetical protein